VSERRAVRMEGRRRGFDFPPTATDVACLRRRRHFPRMTIALPRTLLLLTGIALGACTAGGGPASAPVPAATVSASRPVTPPNPQGAAAQAAGGITLQLVARGDSVFHSSSCTDCHGQRAKGSPHGPDLTSGRFAQTDGSYEAIVKIITTGVPVDSIADPSFPEPMPPRGGGTPPLTDDQIRALAAYVYSLSHR